MMAEVIVKNPKNGDEKTVTSATLGVWRRRGWILVDESKKIDLLGLRESVQEDATEVSEEIAEGEEQ
jgi:hypothetical protein